MALGEKISMLRESQHMSQRELASLVGVTTGTVAEWEADETIPDVQALAKLCKVLSVSSDVLLEEVIEDYSEPEIAKDSETHNKSSAKKRERFYGLFQWSQFVYSVLLHLHGFYRVTHRIRLRFHRMLL